MAKNKMDLTVIGRITNLQGEPLEGLAVRAFDQDPSTPDNLLGEPILTDADGCYAIPFTEADFKIGGVESGGPDVFIRVYRGEALLGESPVTRNAKRRIKIDLRIDHPVDVVDEPARRVFGVVRDADGGPLAEVAVAAFDRDLRAEQELGRSSTDGHGRYRIDYFPRQFRRREKGDADLVVRAFAAGGAPLAASPVRFNAPPAAEIDLVVPAAALRPAALFERVDRALQPLLDGVAVDALEEDASHQDLGFLVGETGFEKQTLARFALAHRLARLGLRPEFWFALLGGSFYAYTEGLSLAEQEGKVLDALPSLDAAAVRKALIGAFTRNDIPERLRTHADEWVEAFLGLAALQSVRGAGEASFVRAALEEAGIADARRQERFARLFNEYRAFTPELLERLEGDDTFTTSQIADLRASYRLAELTQGDFSVVKVLKAEFGIREPGQVRTLARRGEREWVELIERAHAAGDIRLPVELAAAEGPGRPPQAEVYAKTLERRFREAFPTTAFAGGLERADRDGGARGLRHAEALGRLLERHPEFELLSTPVDDFLGNGVHAELRSVAADPGFRSELKALQRTFKLAPTFEAADELLADGIHSAAQVYRLGESEFVRRYAGRPGFSAEGAALAWSRAADTHAAAVTIVADMAALAPQGLPLALLNPGPAAAGFPNWNNLFLSGDACGCEPCRSVLGPAAYFADLLMFLRDRRAVSPAGSVKDVLFRRRPDLGYLELSCENANTPLPYIDVVCGVLERVVAAGRSDVELVGFTSMPAPAAAESAVRAAFSTAGISAGADFSLSQVDPSDPHRWVVHGDEATWLLKKKGTPSFFAQLLPNTKASAAELRAAPAYVDAEAYKELRAARFPFGLPFDLFAEEVRAAFRKCDLQRWELMRTLRGPAAANHATDGEVAAEYFGISSDPSAAADEMSIILVAAATTAGQQAAWGESGNAGWLGTVSGVRTFLRKTGLEYEELLGLIDLPFINPAGDIAVQHLDSSCDTGQKVIQGLNAAKLDRIHRFLRLWRKLDGWKMWELDLVLRSPGVGAGVLDEPFLIQLYHFVRLRSRLGTKAGVAQLCALFGDLGTRTHFTRLHARREDGLYQSLFLNRRLTHPLDPAFAVAAVDVAGPTAETIPGHRPGVLAALGVREADLDLLAGLTRASNGLPYITGDLTLANLSFLWRHAWLPRLLKLKPPEWKTVLMLLQQDVAHFADAAAALAFVEQVDLLTATRFTPDELRWLLAADRGAKAAAKEADAARFLAALRTELGAIRHENDPARYPILSPPADEDALAALLVSLLQRLHRDEDGARFFVDTLRDDVSMERAVAGLPPGFDFPPAIKAAVRIRYDEPAATLRFTGRMTDAEHATLVGDTSLAAVTGIAAYQEAVEDFFTRPRLALKFLDPVFTAPLASLPPAVDFTALPDPALALRVGYDPEQRLLRVVGILSPAERSALDTLSGDPAYINAVNSLATQPALPAAPEKLWLQDADLQLPLRNPADPVNDNLKANLATAVQKALAHLSRTLSEDLVVRRASVQLGATEALTRRLLGEYALLPDPLLTHLTVAFAATTGVVDYSTRTATFDGWFWALRVAALWKKWKLTLREWERVRALTTSALLLDFGALPLNTAAAPAPVERFLRTSRLLRLRDALPETGITLLEVLEKLNGGAYAVADFADDVQRLDGEWRDADVEALVAAVDLSYPGDYLLAENWERLRRGFSLAGRLNAGIGAAKDFAAATMTPAHAKALRDLLRARFGGEAWLTLSGEIQDALRGRKRDALAGWLLTQPRPADAPTGKWENTNDLYAYYLLDVEMGACQLTSQLVAGSGSVQLLVQRCFIGLEPDVVVQADGAGGDSAWRRWRWMDKYRVWEANRKVFLWPENWIEPELRKDRSPFFKELENELLQNEIDSHTVETAFTNYLERLDGVARLEIAGFYQEDDGDETVLHLFGRTGGAEPHVYYYRRYDYRTWEPWEKVDLEIQGDYLVPAVVNGRLFLFWPVFTEVPDEEGNSTVSTPSASQSAAPLPKTRKQLKLQIAASDRRQGKWTPKRVSTQYDLSDSYDAEIVDKQYVFLAVDRTATDGRFGIKYHGYALDRKGRGVARLYGAWEIAGCKGVPELASFPLEYRYAIRPEWDSTGHAPTRMRWEELRDRADRPQNDLSLENQFANAEGLHLTPVLMQTPGTFRLSPPWHLSYPDTLMDDGLLAPWAGPRHETGAPLGSWLPFFYGDGQRTFFVRPTHPGKGGMGREPGVRDYYPEIKREFRRWNDDGEAVYRKWADAFDLAGMTAAQRAQFDTFLAGQFPGEGVPPFADGEARTLLVRFYMRFVHLQLGREALGRFQAREFHFQNFYHPFVCDFRRQVYDPLQGVPHLMKRETQLRDSGFSFLRTYQPTAWVVAPATEAHHPREVVDFSPDGAFSSYNWELFFHVPLLIGNALSRNQRFEEARDWYHFIFNPLGVESAAPGGSAMSKYWIFAPFFKTTDPQYTQQRIENLLGMLAGAPGASAAARKALEDQVRDWCTHPFEPHRIAAYRTVAYQKTVVMKYVDNLIAWGDHLFRQDSMESINEATQLYVLAAEILGPRPRTIPPRARPPLESFNELEKELDGFSNALVQVENLVPPASGTGQYGTSTPPLPMLYFCIPRNEKMLGYWDTVADRLYKIRHCMNIEGVARQLALFEPPIDPAALVKAVAGGVDIGAALADLNAPLPIHRFGVLVQKANEVCGDVKALGAALLSVLEKQDVEALALLRQDQEIRVLEAVRSVREKQVHEAKENLEGVKRSRGIAELRRNYYRDIEKLIPEEQLHLGKLAESHKLQEAAQGVKLAASIISLLPAIDLGVSGFGGSPLAKFKLGGLELGQAAGMAADVLSFLASMASNESIRASSLAGFARRWDDWKFQERMAERELDQFDRQIAAAELRVSIAEKELENHLAQTENARGVDAFLRSKYTSEELYQWQVGQISGVYFQSYRLAHDLARRAERCFRFELGLQDSGFIGAGYWDSLRKGLLAGEKLQYDLRRLEAAHLEQDRRELEVTRHVSLALLDPLALVKLRETGRCFFRVPEEAFDLDYPGHYFRRIRSVSLTLPCIVGPYTTVSCTLRLLKNSLRISTNIDGGYARSTDDGGLPADDPRFVENNVAVKAIAASSGQNDSGVFELNFRDERYLPFEGAGALSEWTLELFSDLPSNNPVPATPDFGRPLRQFDYDSITDAVLHVKYTAREDAGAFKNAAVTHLREYLSAGDAAPGLLMLNLRRDFPAEWSRFLRPTNPADPNVFALDVSSALFPLRDAGQKLKLDTIWLLARCARSGSYKVTLTPPPFLAPLAGGDTMLLDVEPAFGGLHVSQKDIAASGVEVAPGLAAVSWGIAVEPPGGGTLVEDPVTRLMEVEDMILVLGYHRD